MIQKTSAEQDLDELIAKARKGDFPAAWNVRRQMLPDLERFLRKAGDDVDDALELHFALNIERRLNGSEDPVDALRVVGIAERARLVGEELMGPNPSPIRRLLTRRAAE